MSAAYSLDVGQLHTLTCGIADCGISFAIPETLYAFRLQDGKDFYCPNGHCIHFSDNENTRLKREVETLKKRMEWKDREISQAHARAMTSENRRRAAKATVTKVKKRLARGCCPNCKTTFPDLAAHMKAKHAPPADSQEVSNG